MRKWPFLYYRRIIRLDEVGAPDLFLSLSSSSIKTGSKQILRHKFLRLVFCRFRRTKYSDE